MKSPEILIVNPRAIVYEEAFGYLDAPVTRIEALDMPIPFSFPLEMATIPNEEQIIKAVKGMME